MSGNKEKAEKRAKLRQLELKNLSAVSTEEVI